MRVLLVEDDRRLAEYTAEFLVQHGMTVDVAPDASAALLRFGEARPDVVLLDLGLPGLPGLELAKLLRVRAPAPVPLIMVTARDRPEDKIAGLDLGADDYLAKPYDPRELLARIRAVLRRSGPRPEQGVIATGELELHLAAREARFAGRRLELTSQEFSLLQVLASKLGEALSREALLDALRGPTADDVFDRAIDVTISRLRQKLEPLPRQPQYLLTIRQAGYLLARLPLPGKP